MIEHIWLIRNRKGKWFIRAVATNGRVLFNSQAYFSKWNARRAAKKMFPGYELFTEAKV